MVRKSSSKEGLEAGKPSGRSCEAILTSTLENERRLEDVSFC
jgi:hypothetical protein